MAVLTAVACASPKLPPPIDPSSGTVPPFAAQVHLRRPGMTCRGATGAARTALRRMGYSVGSVRAPAPGVVGEIRALRHTGWNTGHAGDAYQVAARINCDDHGATIDAATEEPFSQRRVFKRDFAAAVDAAAQARAQRAPAPRASDNNDLRLAVEPLRGEAAAAIAGAAPDVTGLTPVHIRIDNGSTRLYRLHTRRIKLVTQEGQTHRPLDIDDVLARIAPEWHRSVREGDLADTDVAPGATVSGYVFVPASAYQRAQVILIEAESEEAEGFSVEF